MQTDKLPVMLQGLFPNIAFAEYIYASIVQLSSPSLIAVMKEYTA